MRALLAGLRAGVHAAGRRAGRRAGVRGVHAVLTVGLLAVGLACGAGTTPRPAATLGGGPAAPPSPRVGGAVAWPVLPPGLTIAEGQVLRVPAATPAPGWKEARVVNVFGFGREPTVGSRATVLPLDRGPALELAIRAATRRDELPEAGVWWEVELEPIVDARILEAKAPPGRRAEYPFGAVILHPPVPAARLVAPEELDPRGLPRGIARRNVAAAVDLGGPPAVDALIAEWCCADPSASPREAACPDDAACAATYVRDANGWTAVRESRPQ